VDGAQWGKKYPGETKGKETGFFFFFSLILSASACLPSLRLVLAKKCLLIAKRSRGAVRAVS